MKRKVLTLHGISSDGAWQDRLGAILAPHFEHIPLRYYEFRTKGPLKVAFDMGRTEKALAELLGQYERATADDPEPPHLVAHSFGTKLVSDLLAKFSFVRFDRIVFVGSVLSEQFPWDKLLKAVPPSFRSLRNEVGGRDLVAELACLAAPIRRGLGKAGQVGFRGSRVHTLSSPFEPCPKCQGYHEEVNGSGVHNVHLERYGHSDAFLSRRHAEELWLPYFWGFRPGAYLELLRLCGEIVRLQWEEAYLEEEVAIQSLRSWMWCGLGGSGEELRLDEYLKRCIRTLFQKKGHGNVQEMLEPLTVLAVKGFCETVVQALGCRAEVSPKDESLLRALHPRIAAIRAVTALEATVAGHIGGQ
jgi:pimeloyl-ACP methyl ester carboxylesterase